MRGKRRRGRQSKRWDGTVNEWTEMDFASSTRAVEDRTCWKEITEKSSVVPQRPCKFMGILDEARIEFSILLKLVASKMFMVSFSIIQRREFECSTCYLLNTHAATYLIHMPLLQCRDK